MSTPENGTVAWTEIATSTPEESLEFYTRLFGWTAEEMPGGGYHMLKKNDGEVAGLMDKSGQCDGPPMWVSYVQVPSLDITLKQLEELGGKIMMGATPVEGRGQFALVEDPQRGKFALWESTES
ncbi:MAG: VOC family protein [Verrucomicrobiota bacterium]